MIMLMRALSAESLKLRGTLALWMSLIAPATVVGLVVLQLLSMDMRGGPKPAAQAWDGYLSAVLHLWAFLMLPLFITLQSALIAGLEHGNQQWKHLLSLPVPKGAHYLAKLLAQLGLVALSLLALAALLPLGGWVLGQLRPQTGLVGMPDWILLARSIAGCFAASLLIIAIHTWVATHWRSFTVAVSFGMVATVAGFLIMQSRKYGMYYPWSMPVHAIVGGGEHLRFVAWAGSLGGVVIALAGMRHFVRREDH